jgi:flagellar biosynthesis/type III secretory pathway M-ring protein FliF/YscJ
VNGAIADAKVEAPKNGSSNASRVAVGVIASVAIVGAVGAFLIVRAVRRPLPEQQEEDETSKRSLPETLLNEMEFESPLTLANTAVNADFEPKADDFCA